MWNLVRAQAQANRAATRWFVGLLTVLLTITTYSLVEAGTQGEINRTQQAAAGGLGQWYFGNLTLSDDALPAGPEQPPIQALDEFIAAIDEANAEGRHVVMRTYAWGSFDPWLDMFDTVPEMAVLYGDVPWEVLLVEGRAPAAAGEVALNATVAGDLGVGVGDTVEIYPQPEWPHTEGDPLPPATERVVVGIIGNLAAPGYDGRDIQVFLPLAERELPDFGLMPSFVGTGYGPLAVGTMDASVTWDGSQDFGDMNGYYIGGGFGPGLPESTLLPLTAAFVLIVGMVIMAFAVGRTQAQNRVRWVATTRTLGASSARVALATGLETVLSAAVALVIALPLGYGLAAAHLAWARDAAAPSLLPAQPVVAVWMLPMVIAVALLVSIIAGAVPAYWATRVPPVAAFAPINDLTVAEVSRRLPARWLVYGFALSLAAAMGGGVDPEAYIIALVLGVIGLVVIGFVLIVEALRRTVAWLGRRMARSSRPAWISAGDALAARPRQAAARALLLAVGVGVGAFLIAFLTDTYTRWGSYEEQTGPVYGPQFWQVTKDVLTQQGLMGAAIALATLELIAIAISVGHLRAIAPETSLRSALGQEPNDSRKAAKLLHLIPQVFGAVMGVIVATTYFASLWIWEWLTNPMVAGTIGRAEFVAWLTPTLVMVGAMLLAVTIVAAVGGAILARNTARGTPVDGLREAALVGAS